MDVWELNAEGIRSLRLKASAVRGGIVLVDGLYD
jgi:hypothetical protein